MPNNFLRAGNLDSDFEIDEVKGKVRSRDVLTGLGNPTDPPPVPEKSWVYYDVTDDLAAVGYVWDPEGEAWCVAAAGDGGTSDRVVHTPSDCTDTGDDDGTVLELTVIGDKLDYNRVICDENPSDPNGRAAVVGPDPDTCLDQVLRLEPGTAAVHGPSFWWNKPCPAVLSDLASLPTLSYPLDFTGSPTEVVFDSVGGPVSWTLDGVFADAGALFVDLLTALAGVATFETSVRIYADESEANVQAALVSVELGAAATIEVLDPGDGDPIGLGTLTHTPGAVIPAGYQTPNGSVLEGRGRGGTHSWPDLVMNGKHLEVRAAPGQWVLHDMSMRAENIGFVSQHETPGIMAEVTNVRSALEALDDAVDDILAGSLVWKEDIVRSLAGTPTIAAGAAAGTGPTVSVGGTSTDSAGFITITTGTTAGVGELATITFDTPFPAGAILTLSPGNADAADAVGIFSFPADVPTTQYEIHTTTALADATSYSWAYHVIGQPA